MVIRITGGECRGRIVTGPEGLEARPTASKIRQAFFNILCNKTTGSRFLDLFAGSGLMGLEALSRGADMLVFVEESRKMVRAIESNLKTLGYEGEVIAGDVRRVIPVLEQHGYDIIYADPPYRSNLADCVLSLLDKHQLLAPEGVLAVEHARDTNLNAQAGKLCRSDRRDYGQTSVSFYRYCD